MKVVSYGCHSAWCLSGADQQALSLSSHPLAQTLDVGFLVFLRGFPVPLPRYCREIRYMRYIPSSGSGCASQAKPRQTNLRNQYRAIQTSATRHLEDRRQHSESGGFQKGRVGMVGTVGTVEMVGTVGTICGLGRAG